MVIKEGEPLPLCLLLYLRPVHCLRPYFEITYCVPFQKRQTTFLSFPFLWRRLKIQCVKWICKVQLFDSNNSCFILCNNKTLNEYACAKQASKTIVSYLPVFVAANKPHIYQPTYFVIKAHQIESFFINL